MLENPEESMLELVAKRGNIGASRDDLFKALKGVAYRELEKLVEILEQKGYIAVQWLSSFDFVATITPTGIEQVKCT